jgi:hypothetical protein
MTIGADCRIAPKTQHAVSLTRQAWKLGGDSSVNLQDTCAASPRTKEIRPRRPEVASLGIIYDSGDKPPTSKVG